MYNFNSIIIIFYLFTMSLTLKFLLTEVFFKNILMHFVRLG